MYRSSAFAIALCAAGWLVACGSQGDDDDGLMAPQMPANGAGAAAPGTGNAGTSGATAVGGMNANPGSGGMAASSAAGGNAGATASGSGAMNAGASGNVAAGTGMDMGGAGDAAGSGDTTPPGDDTPTTGPFPAVTDFTADGPYGSTTLTDQGQGSTITVYMPMQPPPAGAKNPIVVWMSGGGTSHEGYPLLPHLATLGFVVIAPNDTPGIGEEAQLGMDMMTSLDWALAENDRMGSPLQGKLDVTKIAAMGYSMGSLATFTIANDPRLTTTVHISGGNMEPSRVMNLRQPAAFICGTPGDDSCNILSGDCDIAGANCATDFMNATTPVFYGVFSYGHLGVLTPPYQTQIYEMVTAWLRLQLMGDTTLKARFVGNDCSYCKDANWKVMQKNL